MTVKIRDAAISRIMRGVDIEGNHTDRRIDEIVLRNSQLTAETLHHYTPVSDHVKLKDIVGACIDMSEFINDEKRSKLNRYHWWSDSIHLREVMECIADWCDSIESEGSHD